jgi:hypothetical protein
MANTEFKGFINVETNASEATQELQGTTNALKNVATAQSKVTSSTNENSQAITDNGGAVALLNTVTGGLASTVKDSIEATQLFTKNTSLATVAQGAYGFVVGTSTGAMKLFRLALAATGIGLLVIGLVSLYQNFDKVKEAVLNLIPGLSKIGDVVGGLIDGFTDFIGVTSEAERALERLQKSADESLAKNKKFLAEQGDTIDKFTKQKIDAMNAYNNALKEDGADQVALAKRLNRELAKADSDRQAEKDSERQKEQDKIDADNQKASDKRRTQSDKDKAEAKNIADEKQKDADKIEAERVKKEEDDLKYKNELILQSQQDLDNAKADLEAINAQKRFDLERERAIREIEALETDETTKLTLIENINKEFDLRKSEVNKATLDEKKAISDAEIAISNAEKEAKLNNLSMISGAVSAGADLLGAKAGVGKAIAVATTGIDTYVGAQKAYTSQLIPGDPTSPARGALAAGVAIISGLANVKKILTTKIPGGGGGGGAPTGGGAPQAPTFNVVGSSGTNQLAQTISNQQNTPIEAQVVASKVSSQQALDRNKQNTSTFL